MNDKYFTIKNYPDDVYNAVGQIIKISQEWEFEYKKLAQMLCVPVKKIDEASLNKLNEALKKHKLINDKDNEDLEKVIKIRNYINHNFYLTDFENQFESYEHKIEKLECILNAAQFLIFEATDLIDNKIDKLQSSNIMRPTVFD